MTDTEEFLAHFGVKGMKWGVRHKVGANGRVTGSKYADGSTLTRGHKIAIGAGAAGAIVLGAAAAAFLIKRGGSTPTSALATVSRLRPNNPIIGSPNPASKVAIGQPAVERILSSAAAKTPTMTVHMPPVDATKIKTMDQAIDWFNQNMGPKPNFRSKPFGT